MDISHSVTPNDPLDFQRRLETFKDWPKQIVPDKLTLAKAGFIYTGQNDKVECFACHIRLAGWETTDDPWYEHRRWSEQCWYLKLTGCAETKTDQSVVTSNFVKSVPGFGTNVFMNKPFQQ